jgi:hypothetical protein
MVTVFLKVGNLGVGGRLGRGTAGKATGQHGGHDAQTGELLSQIIMQIPADALLLTLAVLEDFLLEPLAVFFGSGDALFLIELWQRAPEPAAAV